MPQEWTPISELEAAIAAAKIARTVMERERNDRLATALMLVTWARTLLRGDDPETRARLARAMFVDACWLAPNEDFDPQIVLLVREREEPKESIRDLSGLHDAKEASIGGTRDAEVDPAESGPEAAQSESRAQGNQEAQSSGEVSERRGVSPLPDLRRGAGGFAGHETDRSFSPDTQIGETMVTFAANSGFYSLHIELRGKAPPTAMEIARELWSTAQPIVAWKTVDEEEDNVRPLMLVPETPEEDETHLRAVVFPNGIVHSGGRMFQTLDKWIIEDVAKRWQLAAAKRRAA